MLFCHIVSRTSVLLAIVCAAGTLRAQQSPAPAAFSLVQLAELPRLLDPQLSPNGQSVAYMLGTPDWTANRPTYHLWRQDIGGTAVALTSGGGGDTPFTIRWSPDGASILFGRGGQLMVVPAS